MPTTCTLLSFMFFCNSSKYGISRTQGEHQCQFIFLKHSLCICFSVYILQREVSLLNPGYYRKFLIEFRRFCRRITWFATPGQAFPQKIKLAFSRRFTGATLLRLRGLRGLD